jgi:2-polyprenyl-3-methyl-5-hydroxy-6-metoxy-1,4-benzoquinol methylase
MRHIKKEDYNTWQSYYWTYQKILAEDYYIPYLLENSSALKFKLKNFSVIDIGCGNGGFIDAFQTINEKSSESLIKGIELKKFSSWSNTETDYSVHNILEKDNKNYKKKYDLVILRDVIEHIDKRDKYHFINEAASFMKTDGEMLLTFPPYLSPFGLHQQSIMKSFLRYIPFLSLLSKATLKRIIKRFECEDIWLKIEEIIDSGMTISNFKKILKRTNLAIYKQRYFTIRPSHQIRYGAKTLRSPFGHVPLIREFLVLGTCYILKIKNPSS